MNTVTMPVRDRPVVLVNHLLEPPGKTTGITRYLFALLGGLLDSGGCRYVLTTAWNKADLPCALQRDDLTVVTVPFVESTPRNILSQTFRLPELMAQSGASLEFNCNPLGGFRGDWPRIVTVHDLYFDLLPGFYPRRHRLWWRLFFPMVLAGASRVICVSNATRTHLQHFYPRHAAKAVVVHEAGALESVTTEALPEGSDRYAVFVGNVSPNKNPETLTAALRILEDAGAPVAVRHVGRDEADLLENAQISAGLRHLVTATGPLGDAALAGTYRGARCLVVTSIEEGFCLPVVEAQSFGVPVVCSDIPVLREVAGEGALYFDPHSPAQLAEALGRVFGDDDLHAGLSARATANAERFSWGRAARETEAVFAAALREASSSGRFPGVAVAGSAAASDGPLSGGGTSRDVYET